MCDDACEDIVDWWGYVGLSEAKLYAPGHITAGLGAVTSLVSEAIIPWSN